MKMVFSDETASVCCFVGIVVMLVGMMLFSFGMWCSNEGHLMTAIYLWGGAQICGLIGAGLLVPMMALKYGEE